MPYVIICMGFADGGPCDHIGQYLQRYEPNWDSGLGRAWWTTDKSEAIKFQDSLDAFQLWKTISTLKPIRQDGKPNRPLTAYSIQVTQLKE